MPMSAVMSSVNEPSHVPPRGAGVGEARASDVAMPCSSFMQSVQQASRDVLTTPTDAQSTHHMNTLSD